MAQTNGKSFSILDQMQTRLETLSVESIDRLSNTDLKSVIPWLEYKQHTLMMECATESDVLRAAEFRGGIETCDQLAEHVFQILAVRLAKKPAPEPTEDDNE